MPRRRKGFSAYARRRWRAIGLLLVLVLGSLLVATLTDRGHDPTWETRDALRVAIALSDDGSVAYALRATGENITGLDAHRGETGAPLWTSPLDERRALLRAGEDWVAVATDFPRAFLTVYGDDSSIRFQVPLEGNPRALAGESNVLAIALQAPGNPVLIYQGDSDSPYRILRFPTFVNALDLRGGRVAVGTGGGEVVVEDIDGGRVLEMNLPVSIRSLRLSADGTRMVTGGLSLAQGDLSGLVTYFDLDEPTPLRWSSPTRAGVGFVDMDGAGLRMLSVEETPPNNLVHGYDAAGPSPLWTRSMVGEVALDDAGSQSGVAISPDGRTCVVSSVRGRIDAVACDSGRILWSYGVDGTTAVTFGPLAPERLLANARVTPNGPYDALLLFSTRDEPLRHRLPIISLTIVSIAIVTGALTLGIGYWRLRRG